MTDIAIREQTALAQQDPADEVEYASRCAKALVRAISGNPQLKVTISGRDYLKVEAWGTLGAMTKIDHVEVVWCREYVPPGETKHTGWEARVELRDRAGNLRGAGEAMCVRGERTWANRDEFALRSMAQTRAMGKAYRMALSYVVSLAGYEPTPAEEMPVAAPAPKAKPATVTVTHVVPATATERKELDTVIELAQVRDPERDWNGVVERYARREFGHGVGALTGAEVGLTVKHMTEYLEGLTEKGA